MIVVYDVKTMQVDSEDFMEMRYRNDRSAERFLWKANPGEPLDIEYVTETIHGRRFKNSEGLDVVLGIDGRSRKLLGIEFECIENLKRDNSELRDANIKQANELNKIKSYGFWKRFKCLFTGIK